MTIKSNNKFEKNLMESEKKCWLTPFIFDIEVSIVKQQEEEIITQMLDNQDNFLRLTGSNPDN